jgi:uncharacterized repeat protein (TIGR03803 family)
MGQPPKKRLDSIPRSPLLIIIVLAFVAAASAEWKEKVLYSFQGLPDGAYPAGGVVFDKAGNLYGATTDGGANDCPGIAQCGTVYQLHPPLQEGKPWTESVLYIFKGVNSNDGNTPAGGVLLDKYGNVYGTTAYGGTGMCQLFGSRVGCGTVFELIPPKQKGGKWTEKILHSFQSGKDGYFPWGDLTFDNAGDLYGATQDGGGFGSCNAPFYQYCGTVFKLSPPKTKGGKWTEKVLYAFKSGNDGANPNGGLVLDSNGGIYGTTYFGGDSADTCIGANGFVGCGTVFKLKPPVRQGGGWTEKVLLHFKTDASMGSNPAAGVIFGTNGDLYGTTTFGGQGPLASGTVFRLHHDKDGTWNEILLQTLSGSGGWTPLAGVIFDATGNLYGTASGGGRSGDGTVFELPGGNRGHYSVLYTLSGPPDGELPAAGLTLGRKDRLYSTTQIGGTGYACQSHCGTVFQLRP